MNDLKFYKIEEEERKDTFEKISNFLNNNTPSDFLESKFIDHENEFLNFKLKNWISKNVENSTNLFIIKNVPIKNVERWYEDVNDVGLSFLYLISKEIGLPLGVLSHKNGVIVQDLYPKEEDKNKQLGSNSVNLDFHTENAHLPQINSHIALLCLRGDVNAKTTFCEIPISEIPEKILVELKKPNYTIVADGSFENKKEYCGPVIFDNGKKNIVRYDPEYTKCKNTNSEKAMEWLSNYIKNNKIGVTLEQGDLLLINNYNSVHGRSKYTPNFDGFDRWLKRLNIYPKDMKKTQNIKNNILMDL